MKSKGVQYEFVGIAFPKTESYERMFSCKDSSKPQLEWGGGHLTDTFTWEDYGCEAFLTPRELVNLSAFEGKPVLELLEGSTDMLKKQVLDLVKPSIDALRNKDYPGLEGILLAKGTNTYLVGALNSSEEYAPPLDMLHSFGGRGYSNFSKDQVALSRPEESSKRCGHSKGKTALQTLCLFGTLADLSEQVVKKPGPYGEELSFIYAPETASKFNGGIALLDQTYSHREPLRAVLR